MMLLGFKRRFAPYLSRIRQQWRRFRLWRGDLTICPIHGEVPTYELYKCVPGFTDPCRQCAIEAGRRAYLEAERQEKEQRIAEIATAIRMSHPEIVAAIREVARNPERPRSAAEKGTEA